MSTLIIIPARYASSRYPAKPLALLTGATGIAKPLIQRSYEAASLVHGVDALYVATDDNRIADCVRSFGGNVIMTPAECTNGTERTAAAIDVLQTQSDIIINFQGDGLLTPQYLVEQLITHMKATPDCLVATVAVPCSPSVYRHLIEDQAAGRVGGTTTVVDARDNALYFSKRILPHIPRGHALEKKPPIMLHIGLYAYRRPALQKYLSREEAELEHIEGLEQLRFLYHGTPIHVLKAELPMWDIIELNNPSDTGPIEAILKARSII